MTATHSKMVTDCLDVARKLIGSDAAKGASATVRFKAGHGGLDVFDYVEQNAEEVDQIEALKQFISLMINPNMATATPKPTAGGGKNLPEAFNELCGILRGNPKWQKLTTAHLRSTTKHSVVALYHNDRSITDADKIAMYNLVVSAINANDESLLKGKIGGSAAAAPVVDVEDVKEEEEAKPAPKRKVTPAPVDPPAEEGETDSDEDEEVVLLRKLLEKRSAKPKVDEAAVIDLISRHSISSKEVKDIIKTAMGNGEFPTARVQGMIDTAIKTAAPSFDLDGIVKPRIDALLKGTIEDFIKIGPSALAEPSPTAVDEGELASEIPKPDPTFVVTTENRAFLQYVNSRQEVGECVNVIAVGPHGCGKSSLAGIYASEFKKPMLVMDCANIRERRDWFGYRYAENGTVKWHRSQFDRCLEAGNHVIVLDELPRSTDDVRNTLFPLLDHRRATYLEERGGYVKAGNGTVFFVTANEGQAYTGCSTLDIALQDRLGLRVEVTYLTVPQEQKVLCDRTGIDPKSAASLAEIAETIRSKSIGFGATLTKPLSTRLLIESAAAFKAMGVAGLTYTLLNHYPAEGGENSERAQVMLMVQGKFGSV